MDYRLKFKNREIATGEFFHVLSEANARGGLQAITPSQRGYRWTRLLLDLAEHYEIEPIK